MGGLRAGCCSAAGFNGTRSLGRHQILGAADDLGVLNLVSNLEHAISQVQLAVS